MFQTSGGRRARLLLAAVTAISVSACAGLRQFPKHPASYGTALQEQDPEYAAALVEIANSPAGAVEIRNRLIDRRLRVTDIQFRRFEEALAQENVQAGFAFATAQVLLGGTGALVEQTASQILSAASAGLAGTQQAFSKEALFEQTMPALLAQMIAARSVILVTIMDGRTKSIGEYPLSSAVQDLEAYYFAGSIPGAVVATSADATVKKDQADDALKRFRTSVYHESASADRIKAYLRPPNGAATSPMDPDAVAAVRRWIDASDVAGLPIAVLLNDRDLEGPRAKMIKDLKIQ